MPQTRSSERQIVFALEGRPCQFCDGGTLTRGVHRDNPAIVCEECAVPIAQFW